MSLRVRRRRFAAPFVITAALGGCSKEPAPDGKPPARDARRVAVAVDASRPVPIDAAVAPIDATVGPITFDDPQCFAGPARTMVVCPDDALPAAPASTLVWRNAAAWCFVYPSPAWNKGRVRCPDSGPTLALVEEELTQAGATVWFDRSEMTCQREVAVNCPPPDEATCNPPGPTTIPCPTELLPRLQGVKATRQNGDACYWNELQVACVSGPELILPVKRSVGSINLREHSLECWEQFTCSANQGKCNPPPPRQVECPRELLPQLRSDLTPTRADGKCTWNQHPVKCP